MKILHLLVFVHLLGFNQGYASNEDSLVSVRLTLPKTTIKESKDLLLSIVIKSNKKVLIPKYISTGYIQDSSGFICYQLQKREGQTYKDVKPSGGHDDFAPPDKTDTLQKGELKEIKDNINIMCIPCKGKYRIR